MREKSGNLISLPFFMLKLSFFKGKLGTSKYFIGKCPFPSRLVPLLALSIRLIQYQLSFGQYHNDLQKNMKNVKFPNKMVYNPSNTYSHFFQVTLRIHYSWEADDDSFVSGCIAQIDSSVTSNLDVYCLGGDCGTVNIIPAVSLYCTDLTKSPGLLGDAYLQNLYISTEEIFDNIPSTLFQSGSTYMLGPG